MLWCEIFQTLNKIRTKTLFSQTEHNQNGFICVFGTEFFLLRTALVAWNKSLLTYILRCFVKQTLVTITRGLAILNKTCYHKLRHECKTTAETGLALYVYSRVCQKWLASGVEYWVSRRQVLVVYYAGYLMCMFNLTVQPALKTTSFNSSPLLIRYFPPCIHLPCLIHPVFNNTPYLPKDIFW